MAKGNYHADTANSSMKDPHSPLQYRGIILLSNISKIYSGLLNNRIATYCEFLDIFVDEQNGLRNKRPLGLTAPLSNDKSSMIHSLMNTKCP